MKRFSAVILFVVMLIGGMGGMTGAMAGGELFLSKTFDIDDSNLNEEVTYSLDGKYDAPDIANIRPFVKARLDFGDRVDDFVSGKYEFGGEADVTETFTVSSSWGKNFDPDNTENAEFNLTGYFDMSEGISLKTGYTYNEFHNGSDARKLVVGIGYKFK